MREDLFTKVEVTYDNKNLICTPEWVPTFWQQPKHNVRWVFRGSLPKSAVAAVLQPMETIPAKYKTVEGFLPGLPFKGVGTLPPSGGTAIPDIIAHGNNQKKGWYCYAIQLLDEDGKVVAETDPGGTNDPVPPSGSHG